MLQTLDIKRIDNLKGFICDTVHLESEVKPRIEKCYTQILNSAAMVDSEKVEFLLWFISS